MAKSSLVLNFAFFSLLILLPNIGSAKNFCKLKSGNIGICMLSCPNAKLEEARTNCSEILDNSICCTVMERIVTPNNPIAPPPALPQPGIPAEPINPQPSPVPIVEVTTKSNLPSLPAGQLATAKCEEYKHRVKKRASITTYVFGGTESLSKEFPHMAALGYGQPDKIEWLCGGSLISDQFVVTAAHCVITTNLGPLIKVRLGDLDLQSQSDDANPQDFHIIGQYVQRAYSPPRQYNDIALLKLDRIAQFSEYIAPICLQTSATLPNLDFIATGWGRTELDGQQSDVLMKVNLEYFDNAVCTKNFADVSPESLPQGIMDASQVCAGSHLEEKDTCQGDSGGPLQIKANDSYYLVGVTSFGKACGVPDSPAVYTRVSNFVPWIEEIVWS